MIEGNLLHSETFEKNNLNRFDDTVTDGTSTIATSNTYAKSGSYSCKVDIKQDGGYANTRKIFDDSYGKINVKFWFFIPTGFSIGDNPYIIISEIRDIDWDVIFQLTLRNDSGTFKLSYIRTGGDNATVDTDITIPTNTWTCIEFRMVFSATTGEVSIWKNSKREYTASSLNTGADGANIIGMGAGWTDFICSAFYYDDFEISTGFIGSNVLKGLVSFNFDDNKQGVYDYARSILNGAGVPGTCFIQTASIGEEGYMTSTELQTLYNEGWEIGSHTVNHLDLTMEDNEIIETELADSKTALQNLGFNVRSFASPYGTYNNNIIARIAKYYHNHRSADEEYNSIPINNYLITTYTVINTTTTDTVKGWIDETIASGQRLVLLFHGIVTANPGEYEYLNTGLQTIVSYLSGKYIKPVTMYELLRIVEI